MPSLYDMLDFSQPIRRMGEVASDPNQPFDPFALAAARTGHRGRREGAGTAFVEGGYGIPAIYRSMDEGAKRAFESAGSLQHYGDAYYDPAPVVQQALGAAGAPLVAPAMEGAVLGAGAIRRAAIPNVTKQAIKEAAAGPSEMLAPSLEEYRNMVAQGRMHGSEMDQVRPRKSQLEKAESPIDYGRLYGYSEPDIAHFYTARRGGFHELGYREWLRDLPIAKFPPAVAIPRVAQAELKAADAPTKITVRPAQEGAYPVSSDDLWHGVSKVKLPRPVAEMTSAHEPTAVIAEKTISPEALQGGWLLPAWGDRSRTGSLLNMIGDQRLAKPVEMQGGPGFMAANTAAGAAWASGKPVVGKLAKQVRELGVEGDPVYFPYTAMGERSIDFSHHISDALAEMVKGSSMSKEAVNNFNIAMRKPNAAFPAIEDWPGLRSPKLREYLASAGGDARNKFAKIMDTAGFQAGGLPSVAEARVAATDPRLLNVPTGASGQSIAKLDPEGRVISAPATPHRTYDTQLGGQYVGGLPQSVPKEVMYPDMLAAYQAMGYDPVQFNYLMQRGKRGAPIAQRADQRWVDNISQYLEASRQGQ